MNEKINWKTFGVGMLILLAGGGCVVLDILKWRSSTHVWINIGCSLIASALVLILIDLFVDRVKENPLDVWGIQKIYQSRTKMNDDTGISLKKAKYMVDVIAFGLKSYRTEQEKLTKALLQKGVDFRILTMAPDSPFVAEREKEENESAGQIKRTIEQLIEWADGLNRLGYKGKIIVKGYSCMTLDFYWRVDDEIYIGPYQYGLDSQKTISYKFAKGKGFEMYSNYFDDLWNDNALTTVLTEEIKRPKKKA